jgi:meso-butanediol dehydrogenase / (S,S)-butanediol dehydrogenase / diacetyl reductase
MSDWTTCDRLAVVTGSAGIGLGVAERLLDDGFGVLLCGVSASDNALARARALGRPIEVAELDVSHEASVAALAANLSERISGLDALVNCAGIQPYGTIETTSPDDWNHTIGVNLTGYYLMAHFLYPLLKARETAAIVNIASVQGHQNQRNVLAYATSKGAIHALTRAMALDCARDNIRVNSISPGSIRTPLLEFAARELTPPGGDPEETMRGFGAAHAIGRIGTTAEIAAMVSFLVGPESGFCIGGDYSVDGGLKAQLGV